MTFTLEISPEAQERLQVRAEQTGIPLQIVAANVIEFATLAIPSSKRRTGTELLAQLETDGVTGAWADRTDIKDSAEYARKLRAQGEVKVDPAVKQSSYGSAHRHGTMI